MRTVNIEKKSNVRCEHCQYYNRYSKSKRSGANPLGLCKLRNIEKKYWNKCSKFIWRHKYIGNNILEQDENGHFICKRCKRILTDTDSVARGYGQLCYEKHLKEIIRQKKRLF